MPFSLPELVSMSLHLRDISLGLVELAFPESRPVVREDYRWLCYNFIYLSIIMFTLFTFKQNFQAGCERCQERGW